MVGNSTRSLIRRLPTSRFALGAALGCCTLMTRPLTAGVCLVTTTADSGSGSLRAAVDCADGSPQLDTIAFAIPLSDPGYDPARGVFRIEVLTKLPTLRHPVAIDGATQTTFAGNTNTALLGEGGTVGVDGAAGLTLDGPEVEIYFDGDIDKGFRLLGSGSLVRGLAMYGAHDVVLEISGVPSRPAKPITDVLVEGCVLGSRAHRFALPPDAPTRTANKMIALWLPHARRCTVRGNLVGFAGGDGIRAGLEGNEALTFERNEIRGHGRVDGVGRGIYLEKTSYAGHVVRENLITETAGAGLTVLGATQLGARGPNRIVNNTVRGCGGGREGTGGLRFAGVQCFRSGGNLIARNTITDNAGAGIYSNRAGDGVNTISENRIFANGDSPNAAGDPPSQQLGIDLSSEPINQAGVYPYVTANDDPDDDGILNFPWLARVTFARDTLFAEGFAPAGAIVEWYLARPGPSTTGVVAFGEGYRHIASTSEGGSGTGARHPALPERVVDPAPDLAGGRGGYSGEGGVESSAPDFRFAIPLADLVGGFNPADDTVAMLVTATSTGTAVTAAEVGPHALGMTSEFSNVVPLDVVRVEVCDNGVDDDLDGLTDCEDPDCSTLTVDAGVDRASCPGEAILLEGRAAGTYGPLRLRWDAAADDGDTLTVRPRSDSRYRLTATNRNGCSRADDVEVTVADLTPPTFAYRPRDTTLTCAAGLPAVDTARAVDNCGVVAITFSETTDTTCGTARSTSRTFIASDESGNTASHVQVITFADDAPPAFVDAPADTTVACGQPAPPPGTLPRAEDACGGPAEVTFDERPGQPGCARDAVVRTYVATDPCGNTASHVQVVTFADDAPPAFVDAPADAFVADPLAIPDLSELVAVDACQGRITVAPAESRRQVDEESYELVRTWIARDDCGNETETQQILMVIGQGEDPDDTTEQEPPTGETPPVPGDPPRAEVLVYTGFSPNDDGLNETFTIDGLEGYPGSQLWVFTRWGLKVFSMVDYDNSWSGTWEGMNLPSSTYHYLLSLPDGRNYSGYVQLHR